MAPSLSKNAPEIMGFAGDQKPFTVSLLGSQFMANGQPFLTHVPLNIVATPSPFISKDPTRSTVGSFVGFFADVPDCRHVVPVGKLRDIRFMSLFRFKVWWTTHWTGDNGGDVEHETQMMILDRSNSGRPYVLLLPLLEGPFRASLQPGSDNDVDLCVESGSTQVRAASFWSSLYIHAGDDPYRLVNDAVEVIRDHLGTFRLLEEKSPPPIVDKFGWCTWDAFYLTVHPRGVWEGVRTLVDGGAPPGMVLIDDGWQSICHDDDPITDQDGIDRTAAGDQMPCRLIKFEENYKFRDYKSPNGLKNGLRAFITDLKEEFKSVEHVYVWHALCGYWGGLRPDGLNMPESRVVRPKLSDGLEKTMEDLAVDKIVSSGIGLVPPEKVHEMYGGLHSHLEAVGVDGVKVDVINGTKLLSISFGAVCGKRTRRRLYIAAVEIGMRN